MEWKRKHIVAYVVSGILLGFQAQAQTDTPKANRLDTLLLKQKGVLGTLAQSLMADSEENDRTPRQADLPFRKYRDRIIRNISVQPLDFGVLIEDTSSRLSDDLIRFARSLHATTKKFAVHNNLFFKKGDLLSPYILGTNERYLRDLPFLQDASILVRPVRGSNDSVDVTVLVKDVLSIGGSMAVHSTGSGRLAVKEDNFLGWGDRLQLQTLFDKTRQQNFGFGMEYIKRNILGSFIDGSAGFLDFNSAFSSQRAEERMGYFRLIKPLANPRMRWTYAVSADFHTTANMFNMDSVYQNALKYQYRTYDAWAGWNLSSQYAGRTNEFDRLRILISARVMDQKFLTKPAKYTTEYYYPYANVTAVLGSVSLFRFNYYKTQYIYGFGRNEDIPEGAEASLTGGWTLKEGRQRPYMALAYEGYFLTPKERYINYSVSLGSSVFHNNLEDVNLLTNLDYFGRLHYWGNRWKQRSFINASFGKQWNNLLDEPLLLESSYGLPNYRNAYLGGHLRATLKGESVFFSPWALLYFKFAPFVFGSATLFQSPFKGNNDTRLYTSIGSGVRTRNESLIFGTVELRASYFPKKDAFNNSFLVQLNTNLRFKYNQDFIKRPEFVRVN
jgi:hypothetical protein